MTPATLVFIGITYLLAIAIGLAVGFTGGHQSRLVGLGYAAMFIPAVALLVVRFALKEDLRIRWTRFPLNYVPLAVLLIPVLLHAVMLPVTAAFEGGLPWQDWLTPQADGLYHTPPQRGWGALTAGGLALRIAFNAIAGLIVVSILAFFEEVGWRAWLLPRLAERMGGRRAIVVVAVLWALWHLPFALSGIYFDFPTVQKALLATLTLTLGNIAFGLVIGWLWVRTESVWIVSLAHGAVNNWGQYAFKYTRDFVMIDDTLVLAAGVLAVFVVGLFLVARINGRPLQV
jgi:membrane protease YdiL (CAAX protease family)